jgi:hypothetical protein
MNVKKVAKIASILTTRGGGSISRTHSLQLLLRVAVTDPEGNITYDSGTNPAHSFLIQFLEFIYGMFAYVGFPGASLDATATDGTEDPIYTYGQGCDAHFNLDAPINNDDYGIVVGTDDTAETNTDYALGAQLTEGVGLGNITHNVMNFETTLETGGNVDFVMHRTFTNNTGSSITVKESGIAIRSYLPSASPVNRYHMVAHDVLPAPRTVADKCGLTVWYTWRTTV